MTEPPTGTFTALSAMLPVPDAVHDAPPAPAQVQVAPVSVAGSASVTVAPVTAEGPAFETTMA